MYGLNRKIANLFTLYLRPDRKIRVTGYRNKSINTREIRGINTKKRKNDGAGGQTLFTANERGGFTSRVQKILRLVL